ncbi:RING-4 protein [Xylariales sp. AK1849]|nr:RING-4 protein [Xylariales sp. AK1849]
MTTPQAQDGLSATSSSPSTSASTDGPVAGRRSAERETWEQAAPRRVKRAQVSRACGRCRRLQKGCSESRPCQRCIKTGLAEQCLAGGGPPTSAMPQTRYGSGTAVHELSARSAPITSPTLSPLGLSSAPQAFTNFARESFQRQADLLPIRVIEYCAERFFSRLGPTIPIVSPEYVASLRRRIAESTEAGAEAYCVLLGMCAMVLLQVEEPGGRQFSDMVGAETNAAYGWVLLEEVLAAHRHLPRRSNPSFENVLLTFFTYACHAALLHHGQAFFFLRETTTLYLLLKPEQLQDTTRTLAERLFWVLIASERAHAIRYRRPITLQITSSSPSATLSSSTGTGQSNSLAGFWSLAALFRPLDTSFIAILNTESVSCPPSPDALDEIEAHVNAALDHSPPGSLHQTQKANLRVTQLWLRIIIWQVRLRLGHLSETAIAKSSHTYHYPLEVAKDLALSTRDLELGSMIVHGVGLTEKLFDMACVVVNVLARVPLGFERGPAEEDVRYLRGLITELPGGRTVYEKLMVKHLIAVLPGIVNT